MKIVIIGDGKVGHKLAFTLSQEDHDVILIDQNAGRVRKTIDQLDVICITGDGADADIQRRADVAHADLVVACASRDELNMLSCVLAKRLGARQTIARIRNPVYYQQLPLLREDLGLSMAVNPELAAAAEIARILLLPAASKVETFVQGRVELIEYAVAADSRLAGMSLAAVYQKYLVKILVCAVRRREEVCIPDGEFVIRAGDILHVAASHQNLEEFVKAIGRKLKRIRNVLVCGGGHVGFYLAQKLLAAEMGVKIIESRRERCEELCELLPAATIINADATDPDLLQEEGITAADAVVCLTGSDEENIITALYATSQGVTKVVAKVNDEARARMVAGLGLYSTVSAKTATADEIISYVRALNNSAGSANVETVYQLVDGQIEASEFIIRAATAYTGISLRELPTKPNSLIACIGRGEEIIIPSGADRLAVGDRVVVVTQEKQVDDFSDILE